jgi:AAA family ATP:ADP antiporter
MPNLKASHYWVATTASLSAGSLLWGYEFIRSASNTLYKNTYGTKNLPVVMALMPLGVLLMLYLYGLALTWLGPRRTLFWSSLVSALVIAGSTLAVRLGSHVATGILYIFREAYVVLLIEQYWSFINSSLGETEAKKLNGAITGIASIGAIVGGLLVKVLAEPLGTVAMPFFAAAALIPAAALSDLGYAKVGEPAHSPAQIARGRGHLGLRQFAASPLLVFILLVIVATQVVSTALDLRFQGILQDVMPEMDKQTAYSGGFFAVLNGVAAFFQFIVTPVLLRFVPLRAVHIGIPAVHLATCAVLTALPSLATAGAAYMVFKGLDYSVFRAAKEILYIPLSFDARYRAKEVIDVFGYRFSKGGSALLVVLGQKAGVVLESGYAVIALAAAAAWLLLAVPLGTFYRRETREE